MLIGVWDDFRDEHGGKGNFITTLDFYHIINHKVYITIFDKLYPFGE